MAQKQTRVLLVEDNPADADYIQEVVQDVAGPAGEVLFEFCAARTLAAGLRELAKGDTGVVLLDLGLPDSQGLSTLEAVCRQAPNSPVLVMTGLDDESLAIQAVQAGAQDYLIKGQTEGKALIRAIHYAAERKQGEVALRQANRTLNVIRESNQALIRATDEAELLQRICQLVVTVGGYPLAWIGFAEPDGAKTIRPAAYAGQKEEFLARTPLTWAKSEPGQSPTGRAIRTGQPAVVQDISTDSEMLWQDQALGQGYRSALALPLLSDKGPFGSLNIIASKPHAFPPSEIQLLAELAGDVAYGILALRTRTEHQKAEAALRESEARYRTLYQSLRDAYAVVDMSGRLLEFNESYTAMLGYGEDELRRLTYRDLTPEKWHRFEEEIVQGQVLGRGYSDVYEKEYRRKDGAIFPIELRTFLVRDEAGRPDRMWAIIRDVSERKQAEEALRRTNRTLRTITASNQALIHGTDEAELLQQICQIIVTEGGYPLAWIGFAEDDEARTVRPVAMAGDSDGYLDGITITWADTEAGQGPVGAAIRTGQPAMVSDISTDPRFLPWRREALRRGYQTALSLPLLSEGQAFGAINLYAAELGAFLSDEVELLTDLAGDLAYGILALRTRVARQRAEQALRESEARFHSTLDSMLEGCQIIDFGWRYVYVNEAVARQGRQTREALLQRTMMDLYPGIENTEMFAVLRDSMDHRVVRTMENEFQYPDGSRGWFELSIAPVPEGIVVLSVDITERKRAGEALQENERWLRAIFEQAGVGVAQVETASGRFVRVNQRYCDLLGYTQEAFQRLTYLAITPPEDLEEDLRQTARLQAGKINEFTLEKRLRRADGSLVWVTLTVSALWTSGEQPRFHIAIVQDITARKQAEEALQENERWLRAMFEQAGVGVAQSDIATDRFVRVNRRYCDLLGYTEAQMQRLTYRDISAAEDLEEDVRQTARLQASEINEFTLEKRLRRADGSLVWVNLTVSALWARGEQPRYDISIVQDITARKQAEAALRESEERYRSLFENMQEGFAYCRMVFEGGQPQDFVYLAVNAAFERLTGLKGAAGRPVSEVIPGIRATDPDLFVIYGRVATTGTPEKFEMYVTALQMWFSISVYSPRPEHFVAVFDVITERKRMEEALRHERAHLAKRVEERTAELSLANAALNRAAQLKDEFLASMSHELRTPLTAILGLSETLQMGIYGVLSNEQNEALRIVHESGQHLLDLINDILDLSKAEAGKMELQLERVLVADVCLASVQFVKQAAHKKSLRLGTSMDSQVTTIHADARRLKQMLVNLLSNAVKFTPGGGEIGLKVEGDRDHHVARFTVWDTGIGIAPEAIGRLFQPFVQLDSRLSREYTGTGLGLSLVLQMAELHGGGVSVESDGAPVKGSRFTITLPWQEAAPVAQAAEPGGGVERPRPLHRAVTIEDTPLAAEQLTRYLSDLGITNTVHPSGAGTLEKVLEMCPDVILLDLLLPDVSGWEVLQQLKAHPRTRDIPVIVVSLVDDRTRSLALGAEAHLIKPVALSDLQTALTAYSRRAGQQAVQSALLIGLDDAPLVLLADDNDMVVLTLSGLFKAQGYRLITARNGGEALEHAQEYCPDMILMDIQMPGIDGLEAMQKLRADPNPKLATVPIIALTALAMPGDRERCLAAGADEYLAKPVNLARLTELMERVLKARAARVSPPAAG